MSRFNKKKKKGSPGISTASLPDIVFMLLFFFMVATTMRDKDEQVKIRVPLASQAEKLEDKSKVKFILIGKPLDDSKYGTRPVIQLNDKIHIFSQGDDELIYKEVKNFVDEATQTIDKNELVVAIKVDKDADMGTVTDVKMALRRIGARRINYTSDPK
jgi:biopolymer transport protein ExbD